MELEALCNWIILFGAVSLALINIYNFFAKPADAMKKKREDEIAASIKIAMDELMPNYLEKEKEKRLEEWDILYNQILNDIQSYCDKKFDVLFESDARQNELIELSKRQIVHLMGQKIEDIYNEYKGGRKIPRYKKENIDDLYSLYTQAGGNGHIERIYNRVEEWEVVD